jgi:hypothetical protein
VCFEFRYNFCLKHFFQSKKNSARYLNAHTSSCKVPSRSCQILIKLEFLDRFSETTEISNFMKIRPVRSKLFHPGRQAEGTQRHEADSHLTQFCDAPNKTCKRTISFDYAFPNGLIITVRQCALHANTVTLGETKKYILQGKQIKRFVSQSLLLLPTHSSCRGCLFSLDHTHPHTTFGRTPLDEGSASRRDLYLTT